MASVTKSQLQIMARAAKQFLPRVPFNASWKQLYRLWQIGEPDGAEKHLYLTANDYGLLRKMAQIDSGLDILALDFDMPRQQMSQLSAKEKYANISPEADYVLIKLSAGITQGLMGDVVTNLVTSLVTEHNCSLRLRVDSALALCQQLTVRNLIVVENLDSFDNLFSYSFEPALQAIINNCMVLYRGSHDYSPAGRKRFLHLIDPQMMNVIAFTDLDPAGFMIANTLEFCHAIIVPQLALTAPDELLALTHINSPDDFHKQHRQWTYLHGLLAQQYAALGITSSTQISPQLNAPSINPQSNSLPVTRPILYNSQWQGVVHWLGRNRVSIKQQHMLAKSLPLALLTLHQ